MPASGEATYDVLHVATKVTWVRKGSAVRTEAGRVVVALDFEAKAFHEFTVSVADPALAGSTPVTTSFTFAVTDVDGMESLQREFGPFKDAFEQLSGLTVEFFPVSGRTAAVRADLTAAAFFDVDNTLVQGSSLVHFGRGLAARKYFQYSDVWKFMYAQAKFQLTGRENSHDVAEGRRKALAFIEGRSATELTALGEEIYDEIITAKIWPGTRELAQAHLDAGQQVWLVTATPYDLAEIIARRLDLTGALGTVAESVDGVFTGQLVGDILHGLGKAHAVRSLAIREGLNLKRCTAYSDSINDVPMLQVAGLSLVTAHASAAVRAHAHDALEASRDGGAVAEVARRVWGVA